MLSKSKASPCILTLILSFVLSDYLINLMNCKLKACIRNSGFSAKSKIITLKKVRAKLKVKCFLIRYFSYTQTVVCHFEKKLNYEQYCRRKFTEKYIRG